MGRRGGIKRFRLVPETHGACRWRKVATGGYPEVVRRMPRGPAQPSVLTGPSGHLTQTTISMSVFAHFLARNNTHCKMVSKMMNPGAVTEDYRVSRWRVPVRRRHLSSAGDADDADRNRHPSRLVYDELNRPTRVAASFVSDELLAPGANRHVPTDCNCWTFLLQTSRAYFTLSGEFGFLMQQSLFVLQ